MSILEAVWKQSLYKRRLYVICGARLRTDLLDNRSLAMLLEISKGLIYQTLVSGQPLSDVHQTTTQLREGIVKKGCVPPFTHVVAQSFRSEERRVGKDGGSLE